MNTNTFLTCLSYYGVSTGTSARLEGVYSPTSGKTGYLFNQLYPTGIHESGGIIYGPVVPLINVGFGNVTTTLFTGNQCLRAGYQHSGNFGLLMDIEYSGCNRAGSAGKYSVLLSTVDNPNGLASGFSLSINDANRLCFRTQNQSATLSKELGTRDMVYVGLTENQFVSFGIYSVKDDLLYYKNVALNNTSLNTNSLYFGGHLNSVNPYTGFSGRINNILVFNDDLAKDEVGICSLCSLVTGYTRSPITNSFSAYQITGLYYSGYGNTGFTGYNVLTGQVQKSDGSYVSVIYTSGISGYLTTGEVATPLLGTAIIQTSGDSYAFGYDTTALNSFLARSLEFDNPLTSGDIVEIYTYQYNNNKLGKKVSGSVWPVQTGDEFIQLISNGLNETSGADFNVIHNGISGFYDTDILSYDLAYGPSVVTAYSGYWADSKVLMSGGSYYPPTSQYVENAGIVYVSGVLGVTVDNPYSPQFGYDLFLNGQKIISGVHYDLSTGFVTSSTEFEPILDVSGQAILDFWGNPIYTYAVQTGFVVRLSGQNLPLLLVEPAYHPTGGLPTGIISFEDSELTFLPSFSGSSRTLLQITGNVSNIGYITGFTEQVWVNGLRQSTKEDYILHSPCDKISQTIDAPYTPYAAFRSEGNTQQHWDTPVFPILTDLFLDIRYNGDDNTLFDLDLYWNYTNSFAAIYPDDNQNVEVKLFTSVGQEISLGKIHNAMWDGYDSWYEVTGAYDDVYIRAKMRYVSGNMYGPWSAPSDEVHLAY